MSDSLHRARELFFQGLEHHQAARFDAAEASFAASLALVPGRPSTLLNLGAARVRLGRHADALEPLEAALQLEPNDVEALSHRGVALAALGRIEEALACHDRALAIDPARTPNRLARAGLLIENRRPAEALADLAAIVAAEPGHAAAWCRRGECLQRLDRIEAALASYERALELDPELAPAWSQRGGVLRELGRLDDAAACFEQAIRHGAEETLHRFYLAAVKRGAAPGAPPPGYVAPLFDDYADSFDAHVVGELGYRGHALLVEQVRATGRPRFRCALDLGCGTGLCGPLLRPIVDRLAGVDVSARMLDKARDLGVYDELVQADLAAHLAATPVAHDLLVAADTFIYVGDLGPVFQTAARATAPGAIFCFSIERVEDERVDVELLPSLRYAHSERHVRALAARCGWEVTQIVRRPIREEQRRPIEGACVTMRRR